MESLQQQAAAFVPRPSRRIPLPKRRRTCRRQKSQSQLLINSSISPPDDHRDEESKVGGKIRPFSPASGSSEVTANEEEDMAHCLILLARSGQLGDQEIRPELSADEEEANNDEEEEEEDQHEQNNININIINGRVVNKFNSKRFLETGEYVYQCKTCDRSFPSFQALGGHRASHKKPKTDPTTTTTTTTTFDDENNNKNVPEYSRASEDEEEEEVDDPLLQFKLMSKLANINNIVNNTKHRKFPKVHECSICGAEFSSGQALGGHMRRHRALMTGPLTAAANLALTPKTPESEDQPSRPMRSTAANKVPSLQLDLNLPAPEDDDDDINAINPGEDGFPIDSSGRGRGDPSSIVFSFPALVGCQY